MQKQERNRIMKIIETYEPEETFQAGKRLGEQAGKGQVNCLDGDLGVEKRYSPRALQRDWEFRVM